jgi:hypothetical protein
LDFGLPQLDEHIPFNLGLNSPDMDMFLEPICSIADSLQEREQPPSTNGAFADIEQSKASWPLRDDFVQDHLHPEVQMQNDHPKSSPEHHQMAVDVVSGVSPTPQAVGLSRAMTPTSAPDLAPRKRIAGRDLRRLETDNTKIELSNNHDGFSIDCSKQRRRPNQRRLIPKPSSPQNSKTIPSPQSSKSTPDSARTDQSFASTATQVTSPGSAITTPSTAAKSPASPFSPPENNLVCRECGQVFRTPGYQK